MVLSVGALTAGACVWEGGAVVLVLGGAPGHMILAVVCCAFVRFRLFYKL